jgi:integrase
MKQAKTFPPIAERYLSQRSVCPQYSHLVRHIAGRAGRISVDRVNEWLKEMLETRSTATVRTYRSIVLTLWKSAWEQGLVKDMPRGVMRVKQKKKPTRAWTPEQLRHALAETRKLDDRRTRTNASVGAWLRCWILLGYESGSRMGDLWSFTADHLDGDVLRWTQSKTGDPISRTLSKACVSACRDMLAGSPDGRIMGWVCCKRQGLARMRSFLDSCGLPGTSKFLRRSGATHIEITSPGKAQLHLGHRTPGLAASNYIDWGQVRQHAPQTPSLLEEVTDGQ